MTAKAYLEEIKNIETKIRHLGAEKRRWFDLATSITPQMGGERVQSSGNKQKMADAVIDGIFDDGQIEKRIAELKAQRQEIIDVIESLPEMHSDILYRVYVEYQTLKEVAYARKQTYSWITTAHGIALKEVADILESEKATKSN